MVMELKERYNQNERLVESCNAMIIMYTELIEKSDKIEVKLDYADSIEYYATCLRQALEELDRVNTLLNI